MKIAGIQFPESLLAALRDDRLVVFAGTGVSMGEPANLPSFACLADFIAAGTGETKQELESEDRFLGRLKHNGVDVHTRAAKELIRNNLAPTELHRNLLKLYSDVGQLRIVTTNFDLLFEQAAKEVFNVMPDIFRAPALPLGHNFHGIVHVHGAVSHPHEMVLTDADFGRAYLTEGWARRFLVDLFRHFTILFVGYSHDDVIVRYLARALPATETSQRFALTKEDNPQHWRILGIEPIVYPKASKHDYGALYEGVQRLAETVRRSVLDWQREITELATKPPPLSEEETDIIDDALKNVTTTRFFANAARIPEWIGWLDKRKHLDALFSDHSLSERDAVLAQWLAKSFAIGSSEDLLLLIASHDMHIHPLFWCALGREVASQEALLLDNSILSRWVSALLATAPANANKFVFLWLGKRCIEQGVVTNLLQIFNAISACRPMPRRAFSWPDIKKSPSSRIDVDLPLVGDRHILELIWEKGFKPFLSEIAEPLLRLIAGRLEEQHQILCAWQRADRKWDGISWDRSAIEPHEQDRHPEAIDVLIDAARDCLGWLASNRSPSAAHWCEQLAASETPLLRRLAVYAMTLRNDLTADEKLNWMLAHNGLYDSSIHHEVFQLLRVAYPEASPGNRTRLIEATLSYRWPNKDDPDSELLTARHQYEWLHWLHGVDPACTLIKPALDGVLSRHPEFKPREHPDLTHWSSSGLIGPRSPWTVEELLSRPAAEWLDKLLSFQRTDILGPDRDGLIVAVATAAERNFEWGLELADALAKAGKWDADLWSGLIRKWSQMELDEGRNRLVLGWLSRTELYSYHAYGIADSLRTLVKDGGKPYTLKLLPQANDVAAGLWSRLNRAESSEGSDNWLQEAINHPAGILAEFWLGSLSLWRKQQDPLPIVLSSEYRTALSSVIQDRSLPGKLGRSVLASQVAFFLAVDEVWTKENLIPLFSASEDVAEFQCAWDGFLSWGRLNPAVAELLEPAFLNAVRQIETSLALRKQHFIEYYTAMLGYFVADPLSVWIPELFRYGRIEVRHFWASDIEGNLRDMNEAQQQEWWRRWLKSYWENRLLGVPAPLGPGEVERMLGWLPHLKAIFTEAVDLAVRMPNTPLQQSSLLYELEQSEIPVLYPEAVARLLLYLGASGSPGYIWDGVRGITERLLSAGISQELQASLRELLVKLGLT